MSRLNKATYEQLVAEDIAYVKTNFPSVERAHVIQILEASVVMYYGTETTPINKCNTGECSGSEYKDGICIHCYDRKKREQGCK